MATADNIRELLDRDPFEPFRISLTSGESHVVRDPGLAMLLKTELFLAHRNSDRHTFIPLLHVAAVEKPGRGNGRHTRRRKRRR